MNRGQQFRQLRVIKTGTLVKPVVSTPPSITSAQPGVYKEGVLLTAVPAVASPEPDTRTYRWLRGAVVVVANTSFYLPQAADVGSTLLIEETLTNARGSTISRSVATGVVVAADVGQTPTDPPAGEEAAFAGVDPITMAARNTHVAKFAGCWAGYTGQTITAARTFRVTNSADIKKAFDALRGLPTNVWYKIVLASGQAAANWAGSVTLNGSKKSNSPAHRLGHLFGGDMDFIAGGGGVLIESEDTSTPANYTIITGTLSINGVRGLEIRYSTWCALPTAGTADARTAQKSISIGSSTVTNTGANVYPEACVIVFRANRIGPGWNPNVPSPDWFCRGLFGTNTCEDILIESNDFRGCRTAIQFTGVAFLRCFNNDYQQMMVDIKAVYAQTLNSNIDDSRWPVGPVYSTLVWNRLETDRNMVEHPNYSLFHSDSSQVGHGLNVQGEIILHEFGVHAHGRPGSASDGVFVKPTANPVEGAIFTIQGVTLTFKANPTGVLDVPLGATLGATVKNVSDWAAANQFRIPNLCSTTYSSGGGGGAQPYFELCFLINTMDFGHSASFGYTYSYNRNQGGVQGYFSDDARNQFKLNQICINCIPTSTLNNIAMQQGVCIADRCHLARTHELTPSATVPTSGFDDSTDTNPRGFSSVVRGGTGAPEVDHTFRNCVLVEVADLVPITAGGSKAADGVYTRSTQYTLNPAVLTMAGNEYVDWQKAANYPNYPLTTGATAVGVRSKLNGPFTADAQGRVKYAIQNDGLNSRTAFRAEMYSVLKLADATARATIGPTSPAVWPTI